MLTGARGLAGGPEDLVPFGSAAIRRAGRDVLSGRPQVAGEVERERGQPVQITRTE